MFQRKNNIVTLKDLREFPIIDIQEIELDEISDVSTFVNNLKKKDIKEPVELEVLSDGDNIQWLI